MARNDEGEFELILGNKQLLSVFFIVVVLLGVFFAMGYIVGRNTQTPTQVASVPGASQPGPIIVEPATGAAPGPSEAAPASPKPAVSAPPKVETKAPPKAVEPKAPPKVETKAPPKVVEPKAPPKVETKSPPKVVETKPPPVAPPKPAPTTAPGPGAGQVFLQVAAVKKTDADLLVQVLSKKGFQTTTAPVPGQELVRVLVGPLASAEAITRSRSDLEASGFKPLVRKY